LEYNYQLFFGIILDIIHGAGETLGKMQVNNIWRICSRNMHKMCGQQREMQIRHSIKKYACLVFGIVLLSNCLKPTFHRGKASVASSSSSSSAASSTAATVEFVLGQPDSNTVLNHQKGMSSPFGVYSDGTKIFLAERRIYVWDSIPTTNYAVGSFTLGQPNINSKISWNPIVNSQKLSTSVYGIYSDGTKFYAADTNNHRVLIWNSIPTANETAADVVLGQPDMTSNTVNNGGISASTLNTPSAVYVQGGKLIVADYKNNRVLIWNSIPTTNQTAANIVLGQPDMTSSTANNGGVSAHSFSQPYAITGDGTKIMISDSVNHRILIWNSVPTADQADANIVLGQPNMTSNTANNSGISAQTLSTPLGIYSDGTKFFVTDYSNHRVLIWNTNPSSNQAAADVVLGQPNMTSSTANNGGVSAHSLNNPLGIFKTNSKLFVADYSNTRVLIWNSIPTSHQADADVVIGQPNMTETTSNNSDASSQTLNNPRGIYMDSSKFYVVDAKYHRVLIWNSIPTTNQTAADIVLGQPNMTSDTQNNNGVSAQSLSTPMGIHGNGTKLAVADYENNRVLIWNTIPTTNQTAADIVLGQPDMISSTANNGGVSAQSLRLPTGTFIKDNKFFITDSNNHRVLIWNSIPTANQTAADIVLGQPNMTSSTVNNGGVSAQSLNNPHGLYTDGTKLIVSDCSNDRVLIWNTIPTANQAAADIVLGQADMVSNTGGTSSTSMDCPTSVFVRNNKLYISDTNNSRVLIWNTIPTSNNTAADKVFGQANFTSRYNGGVSSSSMNAPGHGLWSDGTRMYVSDTWSHRILVTTEP